MIVAQSVAQSEKPDPIRTVLLVVVSGAGSTAKGNCHSGLQFRFIDKCDFTTFEDANVLVTHLSRMVA